MCKWYNEMNCYVIASEQQVGNTSIDKITQKALLEQAFRIYASVFDKVKLVISPSQVKEHYLNFPYIVQDENSVQPDNLHSLASDATSDAIFVGNADYYDFPISLLANLLKSYNGELFMGYQSENLKPIQPHFGIYHKSLFANSQKSQPIGSLDKKSYRLLPLPESTMHQF